MHFHRDMLAICDAYGRNVLRPEPSRPLHRLAAARLHLRARRRSCCSRCMSAPRPCCSRRPRPDELLPAIARHRATVCFTAPTAYRAMLAEARRARRLIPAQMRLGRRGAAEGDLRRLAGRDRAQAHGRHRRDRDAAHLHRRPRGRDPAGRDGQAGAGLRGEDRRRGGHATCRPARSGASRCAARPAAATSPTSASGNTSRTAGTSPATPTSWMRTAISGTRRAPTT